MALNSKAYNVLKTLALQLRLASNSPSNAKDATGKANRMPGIVNKNFSFKNKDVILPLYINLVRPHAVQFWAPHHAKNIAKLEAVQRTATKMITSLRNKP